MRLKKPLVRAEQVSLSADRNLSLTDASGISATRRCAAARGQDKLICTADLINEAIQRALHKIKRAS